MGRLMGRDVYLCVQHLDLYTILFPAGEKKWTAIHMLRMSIYDPPQSEVGSPAVKYNIQYKSSSSKLLH